MISFERPGVILEKRLTDRSRDCCKRKLIVAYTKIQQGTRLGEYQEILRSVERRPVLMLILISEGNAVGDGRMPLAASS